MILNERLKELIKLSDLDDDMFSVDDGWENPDLKKFASLIVKDCIALIENEASQYAEPVWAVELVNDIKDHFGVEE